MEGTTLFYFLLSSMVLTIAPGPDNMYVLAKSLASGGKKGVALSAGLASGIVFHTTLVIIGVAALIKESPAAFAALKYAGAAYLLYIAWHAFGEKGDVVIREETAEHGAYFSLYRRGVLMNILNPKVLLFFLAFLPQFVNPKSATVSWEIALLGGIFAVQAFVLFSLLALGAGKVRGFLLGVKNLNGILGKVQGILLVGIAGLLVFME